MKMKVTIALALIVTSLTSCSTWHDITTYRTAEAETGLVVQPMVIELDSISTQMIIDTIRFFGKDFSDEDKPELYEAAMTICIQKHNFDILVSPTYQMYCESVYNQPTDFSNGPSYNVVISGYPAYFKRIRPASPEDSWMIPFYNRTPKTQINTIQQSMQSITY